MKSPTHDIPQLHAAGYLAMCALLKKHKGKSALSVPAKTVEKMLEAYEDMLDIIAFDRAKAQLANTELFPKLIIDRRLAGDHPLRIYREYRRMTQQKLADLSGVSRDMIAMIETGKKKGSIATNKKLAKALAIDLEDLV